jgi:4-carboxymuconolactone decarboxylase
MCDKAARGADLGEAQDLLNLRGWRSIFLREQSQVSFALSKVDVQNKFLEEVGMTRLMNKSIQELTPQQREQYERIGRFRKPGPDGSYGGPFDPWIRSPELARRAVSWGNFIWERTTLERRLVELAIIVTARFWQSNVEWVSHSRMALENGVSQDVIDAVFAQRRPAQAPKDELTVYDVCGSLHETHRLAPDLYKRAVELFGERGLVEIIATIGYYTFVAMTLSAFDIGLAEGSSVPFPR